MDTRIVIRRAVPADCEPVFRLSNDPLVRANSLNTREIGWEEHVAWFSRTVSDPGVIFFIAESGKGDFVGQVRFAEDDDGRWMVSISISPGCRGKGVGARVLRLSLAKSGLDSACAVIRRGNVPSLRLFAGAGFAEDAAAGHNADDVVSMVWRRPVGAPWRTGRVFVVAEMSANHCGDFEIARKTIQAAKEAGADAVKVQTYTADSLTIDCRRDEFLIKGEGSLWRGRYLYELYQKAAMPWEWQPRLKEFADSVGMPFFSTPFDRASADFLSRMGVPFFKIASFEAFDYPFVRYVARLGRPMIISVGVSSLQEMQGAVDACREEGNGDVTLLKCTSAYPADLCDMNLRTISDMAERFGPQGVAVGLSDHSMSIEPAVAAVALGARVIEKHFTLDRSLGGEDSGFSLNKDEFSAMVRAVRNAELALGSVDYSVNEGGRAFARSLFAVSDIKTGEEFTEGNVRSIRPSGGLHPGDFPAVVGRHAACDIARGTPMRAEFIEGDL